MRRDAWFTPSGGKALLVRHGMAKDCAVSVLIALSTVRGACPGVPRRSIGPCCCTGERLAAVWLGSDLFRIVTDLDLRGSRPWIPSGWEKPVLKLDLPLARAGA